MSICLPQLWVLVHPPPFPPNLNPFGCHSPVRTRNKLTQLTNIWKELALCSPHNKVVMSTLAHLRGTEQNTEASFNLIKITQLAEIRVSEPFLYTSIGGQGTGALLQSPIMAIFMALANTLIQDLSFHISEVGECCQCSPVAFFRSKDPKLCDSSSTIPHFLVLAHPLSAHHHSTHDSSSLPRPLSASPRVTLTRARAQLGPEGHLLHHGFYLHPESPVHEKCVRVRPRLQTQMKFCAEPDAR